MSRATEAKFNHALLLAGELSQFQPALSEPSCRPIFGRHEMAKRCMDIALALSLLAIFLLPMLLVALAIYCESGGPIVFRQRRIGYGNRPFEILKFRTMYHRPMASDELRQAVRDDPRVTWVGAVLRRISFDELPQLINVLRGEMSVVGPRPHAPGTCAGGRPFEAITWRYPQRHRVRPGMTGLAQIRGLRGQTRTEGNLLDRLDADLEYIRTWSLRLDFVIMARTAAAVLSGRNAY